MVEFRSDCNGLQWMYEMEMVEQQRGLEMNGVAWFNGLLLRSSNFRSWMLGSGSYNKCDELNWKHPPARGCQWTLYSLIAGNKLRARKISFTVHRYLPDKRDKLLGLLLSHYDQYSLIISFSLKVRWQHGKLADKENRPTEGLVTIGVTSGASTQDKKRCHEAGNLWMDWLITSCHYASCKKRIEGLVIR
ncbi:hypothetical protein C5167_028449 [Papaver somniferum]|nr:hypothetical protein C5167_028449 [Papaver somniferum]